MSYYNIRFYLNYIRHCNHMGIFFLYIALHSLLCYARWLHMAIKDAHFHGCVQDATYTALLTINELSFWTNVGLVFLHYMHKILCRNIMSLALWYNGICMNEWMNEMLPSRGKVNHNASQFLVFVNIYKMVTAKIF